MPGLRIPLHLVPPAPARSTLSILARGGSLATLLACSVATAFAASHGIDPNDVNKNGVACTDFFDYANGAWRASHAIPDYMDRWSKRWESGETNKEHVRDILTEVSKK